MNRLLSKFDIANIFYSNFTPAIDWEMVEDISWMFNEGILKLEVISVAKTDKFLKEIDLIQDERYKHVYESGGSIRHQALKKLAAEFLMSRYKVRSDDIRYEYPFYGYEVDVSDLHFGYLCECGDANPAKVEFYLLQPLVKALITLPYPKNNASVKAYIFSPGSKFVEYVTFKKRYFRNKIKRRT